MQHAYVTFGAVKLYLYQRIARFSLRTARKEQETVLYGMATFRRTCGRRNGADVFGVFYNGISIRNQRKANIDSLLLNRWFGGMETLRRPGPPEKG